MSDAYFTTRDDRWFQPTAHSRGPWDADACHAGPPTALIVRALEALEPHKQLSRVTIELLRPIPMAGFRVQGEVRKPGRSVTLSEAEIFDDDHVYVRAYGMHLRRHDEAIEIATAPFDLPTFGDAVPGPFPIQDPRHDLDGFIESVEVRYDPLSSLGEGGPTTMWMRTVVPILPNEEPTGFQRICPLADCANGVSYNNYLDEVSFINADLLLSYLREPEGEWFCTRAISHWEPSGIGIADAELLDRRGPVGRATQNLLLDPAG